MEKNLGRGQKLKSVIKDFHEKRPENLQDQLLKISSYEYTNESIERFCDELASNEAESPHDSSSSKRIGHIPPDSGKTESDVFSRYWKEFPPLGLHTSLGVKKESSTTCYTGDLAKDCFDQYNGDRNHVPSWTTTCYTEDVTAAISKSPQEPKNVAKGIGRGQRLRMVAESIPQPGSLGLDIERACGTDYTNQSIERFVKELTDKNECMN